MCFARRWRKIFPHRNVQTSFVAFQNSLTNSFWGKWLPDTTISLTTNKNLDLDLFSNFRWRKFRWQKAKYVSGTLALEWLLYGFLKYPNISNLLNVRFYSLVCAGTNTGIIMMIKNYNV